VQGILFDVATDLVVWVVQVERHQLECLYSGGIILAEPKGVRLCPLGNFDRRGTYHGFSSNGFFWLLGYG
jgi:hypothetical protein